ncbi:hypothetical protein [Novosphingobium sp.]|jgi:hypothetical protein|uniref:hypothetical protein n=1 Tax=Novosphingobium sp. TaxID=1874826 RepID=UPI003D6D82A8
MMEPAVAGQSLPRAFLRVGGATLAQHQLGLALALDCQRVICLAKGPSAEMIALQHMAENAGLQFHIATGARPLAGLVTANDELVVIGEGLFVEPAGVVPLLEGRAPAVLVQPVEGGLAAGFERIDINRASAGLMRIPGHLVENLQELPGDCDVHSALTRIALQAGVPMREVPVAVRSGVDWRLIRDEAEAHAVELEWLRGRFADGDSVSPGRAVARYGVLTFGSSLLHAGNASNMLSLGVLVAVALAGGLAWFGFVTIAFLSLVAAALLVEASRLLRSVERQALGQLPPAIPRADVLRWLVDTLFGLSLLAAIPRLGGESLISWMFPPAMLMMLLALIPRFVTGKVASLATDRATLGLVLAFAAGFGQVEPLVEVLAITLVVVGMALPLRRKD